MLVAVHLNFCRVAIVDVLKRMQRQVDVSMKLEDVPSDMLVSHRLVYE